MPPEEKNEVAYLVDEAKKLADDKNWSDAADVLVKALELSLENIRILDDLGWYLSRSKRYKEAIDIYKILLQKESSLAKWPYMIGYQYYDQCQWREAIKWFDQALLLRDNYPIVHYRKGYAHLQLDEKDLARSSFERCISIWRGLNDDEKLQVAKTYSNACFQLGKYFLGIGQTRNAESTLSESVKYGPPDAHKHYNNGKALLRNGKTEDALKQFQIADRIEPRKDYILDYIARAYVELKQYDKAEIILGKIPYSRLKHYHWCNLGKLYLLQDRYEEAVKALIKAIQLQPNNHNYHFALGQAFEKRGDLIKASYTLKQAIDIRKRNFGLEFPEAQTMLDEIEKIAKEENLDLSQEDVNIVPYSFIKVYKQDRGFGFIGRNSGEDLFFHVSEVKNPEAIAVGAYVDYEIEETIKGPKATSISILET